MGTKFTSTYTTLVLGFLEEILDTKLEETDEQYSDYIKKYWKRFLVDCFLLWTKSYGELSSTAEWLTPGHKFYNWNKRKKITFSWYIDN